MTGVRTPSSSHSTRWKICHKIMSSNLGCSFRKTSCHSNTGEFGGKMRTTQSDGPSSAVLRESKRETYCNIFESKYEVDPLTALNKFRFEKSPRGPVCLSTETDHTKTLELLTPVYHVRGWCTRSNIQVHVKDAIDYYKILKNVKYLCSSSKHSSHFYSSTEGSRYSPHLQATWHHVLTAVSLSRRILSPTQSGKGSCQSRQSPRPPR